MKFPEFCEPFILNTIAEHDAMPATTLKRRRNEDAMKSKASKKSKRYVKKQKFYHSSSDDDDDEGAARDVPRDFAPVSLESSDEEQQKPPYKQPAKPRPPKLQPTPTAKTRTTQPHPPASMVSAKDDVVSSEEEAEKDEAEDSEASDDSALSTPSNNTPARKVRKRNDPEAFAASLSKILNTKLRSQRRSEPILSRSKSAQDTNKSLADLQLTHKAQRQLLAEKRAAQEKGRVKDVLGLSDPGVSTAAATAKEKELRRTAQKGVIKLFNAVRAAQVKGEQAEKESREKGLVGLGKRQEKVKEMSKQGFLDMITGGAKKEGSVGA